MARHPPMATSQHTIAVTCAGREGIHRGCLYFCRSTASGTYPYRTQAVVCAGRNSKNSVNRGWRTRDTVIDSHTTEEGAQLLRDRIDLFSRNHLQNYFNYYYGRFFSVRGSRLWEAS